MVREAECHPQWDNGYHATPSPGRHGLSIADNIEAVPRTSLNATNSAVLALKTNISISEADVSINTLLLMANAKYLNAATIVQQQRRIKYHHHTEAAVTPTSTPRYLQ